MGEKATPNWHPISALPMIAGLIDGVLEDAAVQLENLNAARDRPYVLDDALVARVIRSYSEQRAFVPIYREQLARWEKTTLSGEEQAEVTRLQGRTDVLEETLDSLLALAEELKENTIEQVLARDDAQVALDVLTGKLKMPR